MRPVTGPQSWLTVLYSMFAFGLPIMGVLAPKGVVAFMLVTAVLAGLILWRSRSRPPLPDMPLAGALALLVVWCAVASLWTFDVGAALNLTARIATIFAAGLFLSAVAGDLDDKQRYKVGRWLVLGIAVALLVMVSEAMFDFPILGLFKKRVVIGVEGWDHRVAWLNRGATAAAMLCWPVTAFLWQGKSGRAALLLPLAVAGVVSFLTSGAAVAGLIVGALTLLLVSLHRKLGRPLLLVMTLAALAGAPFAAEAVHKQGWYKADWLFATARHRVEIWNFTAGLIADKPLSGWGFDASRGIAKLTIRSYETRSGLMPLHPHNGALQILLELGAVGGAIAFGLLWLLINRLESLPNSISRTCAAAFFATTLTIATTAYGLWQNQWLALMISAALVVPLMAPKSGKQAATVAPPGDRA